MSKAFVFPFILYVKDCYNYNNLYIKIDRSIKASSPLSAAAVFVFIIAPFYLFGNSKILTSFYAFLTFLPMLVHIFLWLPMREGIYGNYNTQK